MSAKRFGPREFALALQDAFMDGIVYRIEQGEMKPGQIVKEAERRYPVPDDGTVTDSRNTH